MELPKEKELTSNTSHMSAFNKIASSSAETTYMEDNFCEQTSMEHVKATIYSAKATFYMSSSADYVKQVYLIFYVEKDIDFKISSLFDSITFNYIDPTMNNNHMSDNSNGFETLSSTFIETLNTLQKGALVSTEGDKRRIMLRVPFFFTHGYNQIVDDIYNRANKSIIDSCKNLITYSRTKRLLMNGYFTYLSYPSKMVCFVEGLSKNVLDLDVNIQYSLVYTSIRKTWFPMYCYGSWGTVKNVFVKTTSYKDTLNFDIRPSACVCKFIYTLRDVNNTLVPIKTIKLGAEMATLDHFVGDFLQKKNHQTEYIYVQDHEGLIDTGNFATLWVEYTLYDGFEYKYPLTSSVDYNFIRTIKSKCYKSKVDIPYKGTVPSAVVEEIVSANLTIVDPTINIEVVDPTANTKVVGTDVVGTDVVGTDVVGTKVVGTDVVGTDVVTDVVGTDVVGTDVVGTDVVTDVSNEMIAPKCAVL